MAYFKRMLPAGLSPGRLYFIVPAFLVLTGNWEFFDKVTQVYPWSGKHAGFLISLGLFHYSLLVLLIVMFSVVLPIRPVASLFILVTAAAGYFSDQLGVMIDADMIGTMFETSIAEAVDLLNAGFLMHLLLMGVVPAGLIWLTPFHKSGLFRELRLKIQSAATMIVVMVLCVIIFGDHYASFFREHKPLRHYMHPTSFIVNAGQYIKHEIKASEKHQFVTLSDHVSRADIDIHSELIIMVVGETARADHFSLNGYERQTNPRLAMEESIISYSDISSCGTLTAMSVPCMFSHDSRENFDLNAADYVENALDLLKSARVNILWRDNNSDSKGVAARVAYQDYKSPEINPNCDVECRDSGMLEHLQNYIDSQQGDVLIILHSMGSHGPAYYKRYPEEFEQFTPACKTLELSQCSKQEIINAYDNTILYTDYFLSKIIELLKRNSPKYEAAMFYVSDHGESLGESGLYLHGMPYMLAPDEQIKVPVIVWAGEASDIDIDKSYELKDVPNTHDAVFDTLLTLFEIKSDLDSSAPPLVVLKEESDTH